MELLVRARQVPVETIDLHCIKASGVELLVRRDDLVDEQLSGNKFYKLFYNIECAEQLGYRQILSFGGAYSNHLYSLAAAGKRLGFATVGVVRGERPVILSPTLLDAERWGMRLVFVGRADYRELTQTSASLAVLLSRLRHELGGFYCIPEGGANLAGAQGMQVLGRALDEQLQGKFDSVCLACGTGTGLAGVAAALGGTKSVLGFSVLKGSSGVDAGIGSEVARLTEQLVTTNTGQADNWRLISGFHGGGYGKRLPPYLQRFWQTFEQETGLQLDPVYTLKMFWGITRLAQQGYWPKGSRVVAIHSGGLQGRRGFTAPNGS